MRKLRSAWGIVAGLILLVVLLFVGGSAYGHWRMDPIADLAVTSLLLFRDQRFRGYCIQQIRKQLLAAQ